MAGLQVPVDQPCIALKMVGQITQSPAADAAASAKKDQKSKHEMRKVWWERSYTVWSNYKQKLVRMENYKNKDIYIDKVAAVAELASECFFHGK